MKSISGISIAKREISTDISQVTDKFCNKARALRKFKPRGRLTHYNKYNLLNFLQEIKEINCVMLEAYASRG